MASSIVDSPITTRIVLGFLRFLAFVAQSVPAPDQKEKIESIEVLLIDIFNITASMLMIEGISVNVLPSSNLPKKEENVNANANSNTPNSICTGSSTHADIPRVLLFQEFNMVLSQTEFYYPSVIGQNHLDRESYIKQVFDDAIEVLTKGGYETLDRWNLADALNTLGNQAMADLCYVKAIDMYACAIALWKNNPIFFCNRGAALTKVCKFWDATCDCYEAIRLEPRYVLAYYRLGCAYFESGKNIEAISEGFTKALHLDPNNEDVLISIETLQQAENKIREETTKTKAKVNIIKMIFVVILLTLLGIREDSFRIYDIVNLVDDKTVFGQIYRILIPSGKRPSAKLAWVSQESGEEKSFKGKGLAY
ncbi:unnamed protein product [Lupinus luteus]|uniref:Uncharacterized protein n=1 Tax=Lupinus luteus TaxID=3873 RepID=A0AAV1WKF7_LUPLU